MSADDNRKLALRFFELVGSGDIAAACALFAEDATYWNPGMGRTDIAAMRGLLEGAGELIEGAFSMEILATTAEADRVAVEAKSFARLKRGGHYANSYCFVFEVQGGRIASLKEYTDTAPTAVFAGG